MICPNCNQRLVRTKTDAGFLFRCGGCGGRAVGLSVLRRAISPDYVRALWRRARGDGGVRGKGCPICGRGMVEVSVTTGKDRVPLDICTGCQFVWFDPREFEQFRDQPRPATGRKQLPLKAREAIALAKMESVAKQAAGSDFGNEAPDDLWKIVPAMLGLPVEQEVNPICNYPWLTWALAAAMVLTFVLTVGNLQAVVEQFGLIPAEPLRHGGATLITSFFLHGGLLHLVGNVYFLIIFGDNVEDYLGPWRYWSLIFGAAVFGGVLHIMCDPRSVIPCVGASGGISGVIVFYALKFPRARLGFMIRFRFIFRWIYVPAWCALIGWFLLQLVLGYLQFAGVGHVSATAHLGGAGVGVCAWLLWREGPARQSREQVVG